MEGEISSFNREAIRGPNGIWNELLLPVMEWEAPEHRVVLPESLVTSLSLPVSPVLRWNTHKYRDVTMKHSRDIHVIQNLSRYLFEWQFHGEEAGERSGNQRILFQDEMGRWYAVRIGPLQGSDNMITIVGSRRASFLNNRLSGLKNVVRREK